MQSLRDGLLNGEPGVLDLWFGKGWRLYYPGRME